MRIAVDAMGGDRAPCEVVAGAVNAALAQSSISKIILVGDEVAIRAEFEKLPSVPENVVIHHAAEVVGMGEAPALAVRKKKDSSIGRAVDLVKKGEADAVVSAGNTGAAVVAASLKLRTLGPVERPTIATVMPTCGEPFVLVDAGANIDCSAALLAQFAAMGTVYCRQMFQRDRPVVGLVSIGGEASKGNEVTKEAFRLLSESKLNFKGNVEGRDLFEGGTDVVVCDGFVGNIILKTSESVAKAVGHLLKRELVKNPVRMMGTLLLKGALRSMKKQVDPETYGGAPLLGVNGVCIIAHGSSSRRAIAQAIGVARESVDRQLNDMIVRELETNGF
jgi:glycerol-3-phosphate acyltransferase PlsX